MPIDWHAERAAAQARAEQSEDEYRDLLVRLSADYHLTGPERDERNRQAAIGAALGLLEQLPEEYHQQVKDAAEESDLSALGLLVCRLYGLA